MVSLLLTGVVPYTDLNVEHPFAVGIQAIGQRWLSVIVEIGAICGLISVILVMMMGQPRIFYSMAHDGLLPKVFAKIHPEFGTPYVTTITTGILVAVGSGLLPIQVLAELTSVGTLFAFFLVCIGVMILRVRHPDAPRPFKVPGGPYLIPSLGALTSFLLFVTAQPATILRLFIWMLVGILIYALYGRRYSVANHPGKHKKESSSMDGDEVPMTIGAMEMGASSSSDRLTGDTLPIIEEQNERLSGSSNEAIPLSPVMARDDGHVSEDEVAPASTIIPSATTDSQV